ncbi:17515_t:CDS:2 [Funneliformis caledonium]|uniref:17515_t:CDS:1 n=1 Tax=Funneliformis caledonium TaxID=1117310 RepID=A0A9N9E053_9GLOM|nr:17515_t:CDS:2 [Funneliformis caledonium]
MSRKSIHKYFKRETFKWNVLNFLNECDIEPFERKIDCYTSSLDIIVNNKKDRGCKEAQTNIEDAGDLLGFLMFKASGRSDTGPIEAQSDLPGCSVFKASSRAQRMGCSDNRPNRELARKWEKKRSNKPIIINNGTVNSGTINGGTVNDRIIVAGTRRNQDDHIKRGPSIKRAKIDEYFHPVCETQQRQWKNYEESDDQPDGYITLSPQNPTLISLTIELPILDPVKNPFLEEDSVIISIDDILSELSFEYGDSINDFFLQEANLSRLFCNYQNKSLEIARTNGLFIESNVHEILSLSSILMLTRDSHSNIMINLFGTPLLDKIHEEFMPKQQIELDLNCESTFRKAIKMAMKNSRKDATNWILRQLANEEILREDAGYTILDCLRTLSMSTIRNEHSEMTHITNYLDRIMRGFFDDPN